MKLPDDDQKDKHQGDKEDCVQENAFSTHFVHP